MNRDEELDQLREENQRLHERVQHQEDELHRLRQSNEDLRAGLRSAISSLQAYQKQVAGLEEVITGLRQRVNTLEHRQAKDSHNCSQPPSSDRFVRQPKSLRKQSGKRAGGQPGHEGHAMPQVAIPDAIRVHCVERCAHCQHDLSAAPARLAEKRQVMDLPAKRLWITEHQAEEKQCPACQHLTRASFPAHELRNEVVEELIQIR